MRSLPTADTAALAIIAVFTAARIVLAAVLGLGVDEAYTLSVAHDLDWSYYDHPPLQYWIAHFFMPLLGDGRAARLPFIGLFALSCWLLYRLTQLLFGAAAGVIAVLALNCSAFFSFAGGWVLPDGPLMPALLAAALALARHLFAPGAAPRSALRGWIAAGFWLGVAALAKYHAVLFAVGVLVFLVTAPGRRNELRRPSPWLAALLAVGIATPVILWNIRHDWISIGYQASRGHFSGVHPGYLLANLLGQAIWMLPWIFVPMLIAAWRTWLAGPMAQRSWFCLCLAAPTLAVFTLIPLWGGLGLPHWQMPGWLMLYPVLGEQARRSLAPKRLRHWGIACACLLVLIAAVLTAHAVSGAGWGLAPRLFARGDPSLEAFEWGQLPAELQRRVLLERGMFFITTNWRYAGRIDQAFHDAFPVVVVGANPKQFGLRYDPARFVGHDALLVEPAENASDISSRLRPYFVLVQALEPFALGRSGRQEIPLHLLRARCLTEPLPSPYRRPATPFPASPPCLGRVLGH